MPRCPKFNLSLVSLPPTCTCLPSERRGCVRDRAGGPAAAAARVGRTIISVGEIVVDACSSSSRPTNHRKPCTKPAGERFCCLWPRTLPPRVCSRLRGRQQRAPRVAAANGEWSARRAVMPEPGDARTARNCCHPEAVAKRHHHPRRQTLAPLAREARVVGSSCLRSPSEPGR
eukprot:4191974-Prymnesium_polylepis.1